MALLAILISEFIIKHLLRGRTQTTAIVGAKISFQYDAMTRELVKLKQSAEDLDDLGIRMNSEIMAARRAKQFSI